jgi:hypothetical protein
LDLHFYGSPKLQPVVELSRWSIFFERIVVFGVAGMVERLFQIVSSADVHKIQVEPNSRLKLQTDPTHY